MAVWRPGDGGTRAGPFCRYGRARAWRRFHAGRHLRDLCRRRAPRHGALMPGKHREDAARYEHDEALCGAMRRDWAQILNRGRAASTWFSSTRPMARDWEKSALVSALRRRTGSPPAPSLSGKRTLPSAAPRWVRIVGPAGIWRDVCHASPGAGCVIRWRRVPRHTLCLSALSGAQATPFATSGAGRRRIRPLLAMPARWSHPGRVKFALQATG